MAVEKRDSDMPFDEDVMTLIMGVSPEEPGPHGRMHAPAPGGDAIGLVTKIRDMCEDFLMQTEKGGEGKEFGEDKHEKPNKGKKPGFSKEKKPKGEEEPDFEEEEE